MLGKGGLEGEERVKKEREKLRINGGAGGRGVERKGRG